MLKRIAALGLCLLTLPAFGQSSSSINSFIIGGGGGGADTKWVTVGRGAAPTSATTQDITGDLDGATPEAAIVWVTSATANATTTAREILSFGVTDCTNHRTIGYHNRDGVGTMQVGREHNTGSILEIPTDASGWTADGAATASCIADGIRLDWTSNPPAAAHLVHMIAFDALDAAVVGNFSPNATQNSGTNVTALGSQADFVFLFGNNLPHGTSNTGASATYWGVYTDATTNDAIGNFKDNVNPQDIFGGGSETRSFISTGHSLELSTHTSGFTATTRDAAGDTDPVSYLAIDFATGQSAVANMFDTATSTGNQSITGLGIDPEAVFFLTSNLEAASGWNGVSGDTHESVGFGAADKNSATEFAAAGYSDEAATTSVAKSYSVDDAIYIRAESDAETGQASLSSWDTGGFTLNWSSATTNARKVIYVAFEDL